MTAKDILEERSSHLSSALSLSYESPLLIVRGQGQYLYDEHDVEYLDCVNNVCHVGHCHHHVISKACSQLMALNTNTRYLHPNIVLLAKVCAKKR